MTGAGTSRLRGALLATATLLIAAPSAFAASTYTVTGTGDTNPTPACTGTVCPTLRGAVLAADADPGSTVQLGATTYTLSQQALVINPASGSLTIAGAGDAASGTTIVQTHAGDRVIHVSGTQPVTLSGMQITGGSLTGNDGGAGAPGGNANGGGILNDSAPLTLDHVAVLANTATGGDGGAGNGGNPVGGVGGNAVAGIFSGGQLSLTGTTVTANVAKAGGGGAGATGGFGGPGGIAVGGIEEHNATGPTSIQGSAISSNKATGGVVGDKGAGTAPGDQGGSAIGGVLRDAQPLTLADTSVDGNSATGGAGIGTASSSSGGSAYGGLELTAASGTALTVTGGSVTNNIAKGGAGGSGGFAFAAGLTVGGMTGTVAGSVINGNHSTAGTTSAPAGSVPNIGGGGLFVESGTTLTVTDTTIAQNAISGGSVSSGFGGSVCGGGLNNQGNATLIADTIAGNTATGGAAGTGTGGSAGGAGLCLYSFGTTVLNSTITGNFAFGAAGGGDAGGGGIELEVGPSELANDTVAGNGASAGAGGSAEGGNLVVLTAPPNVPTTMTLADTIIAEGSIVGGTSHGNCSVVVSQMIDLGGNVESTTPSDCGLGTGDLIGVDPMLGALADNGGPTQTMALGAGSPALGAGGACVDPTKTGSPRLTTDQRGEPRGGECDIGAFQSQKPASTAAPALTGTVALGKTIGCSQGTWSGDAPLTYVYQFSRGGNSISGATSSSYKVASADIGHALSCTVTATNPYASTAASSASASVPPKPSISKFHQSHVRWHASSKKAKLSSAAGSLKVGTTFSFKLNTSASLKLTFKRCTIRRGKARCAKSAGTLSFSTARAGKRRIAFAGKLSKHKKLKPGSYEVTVTASNSSGKKTSNALHFTVLKS